MAEKVSHSLYDNPIRVLEIGSGRSPAITDGGTLFQQPNILYVSLDVRPHQNATRKDNLIHGNAAHMPFADNSFDYVLMRSIFGQFTGFHPLTRPEDITKWGMYESFRVLKEAGKVIISEENTPWDPVSVKMHVANAGFELVDFAVLHGAYKDSCDTAYRRLRDPFFGSIPVGESESYMREKYILEAQKPRDPVYQQVDATIYKRVAPENIGNDSLYVDIADNYSSTLPSTYTLEDDIVLGKKYDVIASKQYRKGQKQ